MRLKNKIKHVIDGFLRLLPYIKTIMLFKTNYVPPGHFYSPVPSVKEVLERKSDIFNLKKPIPSIDLNQIEQFELLNELKKFYGEIPFPVNRKQGSRYFFSNTRFSYSDAVILYSMIRYHKPSRIIEVGSGYSSAVTLDTNDLFFDGSIKCTFIEPYPNVLHSLLLDKDKNNSKLVIRENFVQDIEIGVFKTLGENDILFIDSSHVARIGSDVCFLLFEVLPVLKPGVIVHFHDIFNQFEYPIEWIKEGRAWNEAYILRAFLQYNDDFKIIIFSDYLETHYKDWYEKHMPLCLEFHEKRIDDKGHHYNIPLNGQSLWLKKVDKRSCNHG